MALTVAWSNSLLALAHPLFDKSAASKGMGMGMGMGLIKEKKFLSLRGF